MSSFNKQFDDLFDVWRKNEACSEGIPDGHVDEKVWSSSKLNLMVLLKEVNSNESGAHVMRLLSL